MFVPKRPLNLGQQQIQVAQLLSEELPDLIYNTLPFLKSTSAWHPKHLYFGNLKSKKWGGQQSRRQSHLSVTKHNIRRQTIIFSLCVPLSSTYLRSKQQRLLSSTCNFFLLLWRYSTCLNSSAGVWAEQTKILQRDGEKTNANNRSKTNTHSKPTGVLLWILQ